MVVNNNIDPVTGLSDKSKSTKPQTFTGLKSSTYVPPTPVDRIEPTVGVSESKYNINLPESAFTDPQKLEQVRAVNQPLHHEMGNSIVQLGAEITGGLLDTAGYMFEFANGVPVAVNTENLLFDWANQLKDTTEENFKIYNADPGGFMLGSSENFFQTVVSLGSTLALMLPSIGVSKLVGRLGKLTNFATRGSKIAQGLQLTKQGKYIRDGVSSAVFSRHIESNMEAAELYKSLIQEGVSEEEALERSKDLYAKNWVMLLQDIPQYLALGKIYNPITGKMTRPKDMFKNVKESGVDSYVFAALSEAGEEGYQYIVSQVERSEGLFNSGKSDYKSLGAILGEAVADPEFWNSAIMGAVGGAGFKVIFDNVGNIGNKKQIAKYNELKQQYLGERGAKYAELDALIKKSDEQGNPDLSLATRKIWNFQRSVEALSLGQEAFNSHIEFLENLQNLNQEELEMLKENGVEIDVELIQKVTPELIEHSKKIYSIHTNHLNQTESQKHAIDLTSNRVRADLHRDTIAKLDKELDELIKDAFPKINNLSNSAKNLLDLEVKHDKLRNTKKQLSKILTHFKNDPEQLETVQDRIDIINEEISKVESEIKDFDSSTLSKIDKRNIKNVRTNSGAYQTYLEKNANKQVLESQLDAFDNEYSKLLTSTKYTREKINKNLTDRLNKLGSTNLKGLEEVYSEYEKDGLLGDTELVGLFNNKRKSIEDALDISLEKIAEKVLKGEELTSKELQYTIDYEDRYTKAEIKKSKELSQKDPTDKDPEVLKDTTEDFEVNDESEVEDTYSLDDISSEGTQEDDPFGEDRQLEATLKKSQDKTLQEKKAEEETQPIQEISYESIDLYPGLTDRMQAQNPTLTTWLKLPIDKTQFAAEFEITEEFGKGREDIKFKIVNKQTGEDVKINDNFVTGFLLDSKAPNEEYRKKVQIIRDRLKQGKLTRLNIKNQLPLQLNKPAAGNVVENKITDVFGGNTEFVTVGKTGWINVSTGESMFFGKTEAPKLGQKGQLYIVVTDNTGNKVPVKLNRPRLSNEHLDYVTSVIKELIVNKRKLSDFVSAELQEKLDVDSNLIGELTYDNVINFFVYMNTNSVTDGVKKGLPNTLYAINGKVVFSEKLITMTAENFNDNLLKDFLANRKRYNIKKQKLQDEDYYNHIISNLWLNTDKEPNKIFMEIGQLKDANGNNVEGGRGQGYIYFEDNFDVPGKPRILASKKIETVIKEKESNVVEDTLTLESENIIEDTISLSEAELGQVENPNEPIVEKTIQSNSPFVSTVDLNFQTEDIELEDVGSINLNEDLNEMLNFERDEDVQDNKKCPPKK